MSDSSKGSQAIYIMVVLGILCMLVVAGAAVAILEWNEAGAGAKAARAHRP